MIYQALWGSSDSFILYIIATADLNGIICFHSLQRFQLIIWVVISPLVQFCIYKKWNKLSKPRLMLHISCLFTKSDQRYL